MARRKSARLNPSSSPPASPMSTNGHAASPNATRKRTNAPPSNGSTPSITTTSNNLPPPRRSQPLKSVSAPLSGTRLNRFVYALVLLTALMASWYGYRLVQHKKEVGGWWNLVSGKGPVPGAQRPPVVSAKSSGKGKGKGKEGELEESIEDRINGLARALGIGSPELAGAIAAAVRQHVPPASLSSIAAKETGTAVRILLNEQVVVDDGTGRPVQVGGGGEEAAPASAGIVDSVVGGMGSFVGMDEP